jgi:hypothetical protein
MAIPTKDSALVEWSTNANTRLTASPATYGTTAAVATQYASLHDAFILALNAVVAARAAGLRSSPLCATKDNAKNALLAFARPLYKTIQANTAVTAAAKIELGIVVPDVEPSPQPVPADPPLLRVDSVDGRVVRVSLRDVNDPDRARIPAGVNGAIVMSFVGATAPTDPRAYKMEGPTSRTTVSIIFPETVEPGSQVWLTAMWFNERKQMGPACVPVGTQINFGGSMPVAA